MPLLVRWPGKIPPKQVSRQVGIVMDLTATILAATGTPVPPDARLDGIDLLPILRGQSQMVERTLFFRMINVRRHQRVVRQGDWKLMIDGGEIPGRPCRRQSCCSTSATTSVSAMKLLNRIPTSSGAFEDCWRNGSVTWMASR